MPNDAVVTSQANANILPLNYAFRIHVSCVALPSRRIQTPTNRNDGFFEHGSSFERIQIDDLQTQISDQTRNFRRVYMIYNKQQMVRNKIWNVVALFSKCKTKTSLG